MERDLSSYAFDPARRIWSRPGRPPFAYSDGAAIEEQLLAIVAQARDLTCGSPELAAAIRDWPTAYHLSPARHCLLRGLDLPAAASVLELGAGCGAITRHLGERGAHVTAVEGSERRAQIAAMRCRDLPNVRVICDDIAGFAGGAEYDVVTLIGVLEYATVFHDGADPIAALLRQAAAFLKPHGVLVVAIENQVGLKYWNGCREDHLGRRGFGIQDLYQRGTVTTLGRAELCAKLRAAGLPATELFFPFPDYKLPSLVLSEAGLRHDSFRVADLLSRASSPDRAGETVPVFHEGLAWRALVRNQLVPELAHSFLVLARRSPAQPATWLARSFSAERVPAFATETVFQPADGQIVVGKSLLFGGQGRTLTVGGMAIAHRPAAAAPYLPHELYLVELQQALARGAGVPGLATWASRWLRFLRTAGADLAPALLDAIPANFVRTPGGELLPFDIEWYASQRVPFEWVVVRGVVNSLAACPRPPALAALTLRQIVDGMLQGCGEQPLGDAALSRVEQLEDELRAAVYGPSPAARPYAELLARPPPAVHRVVHEEHARLQDAERQREALQREVERVKATVSWRVTAPLRASWNAWLKVTGRR